jgi:hypothetical protein
MRNHNLNVIKYLVDELKIDLKHTNYIGDNGFTIACKMNPNLNIIRYLVDELKMNVMHVNRNNDNGFIHACYDNPSLEIIRYLIEDLKMDINHEDNNVGNGFINACDNPNPDIIRYLSENTNIEQRLDEYFFRDFKRIVKNQLNTNNYIRFIELIETGIKTYEYENENDRSEMTDLFKNINSLMLKKSIINEFNINDPFDLKFKIFVTKFDVLTTSVKNHYVSIHRV